MSCVRDTAGADDRPDAKPCLRKALQRDGGGALLVGAAALTDRFLALRPHRGTTCARSAQRAASRRRTAEGADGHAMA